MSEVKQVIIMRKDLNMRKGKMCAQAAHASLGVFRSMMTAGSFGDKDEYTQFSFRVPNGGDIEQWLLGTFTKITVCVNSEEELLKLNMKAEALNLPRFLCTDAGKTEFKGVPTRTCLAIGPAKSEDVDKITGGLKLL